MIKTITTSFDELREQGFTEVTDYCRYLMELNPERYKDMVVEVYRGEMLCLIVKSVSEAAKLKVCENKTESPHFEKYKEPVKMSAEIKAALALKRPEKGVRAVTDAFK